MTFTRKIETELPGLRNDGGWGSAQPVTFSGGVTASAVTNTGAQTNTGVFTPTGGVAAAGGFSTPTVFHSGGTAPFSGVAATSGATNASVVTTQTYVCEVFVPVNATLTGVSVLNGTAVAGNLNVGLANSSGTVVAQSATTTAATGTSTYQQVPFTATYAAKGPAKYFVLVQGSNTGGRFNAHTIGNFGAMAVTSETYGTFLTTAAYSTTTFTTAVGPVADVY
jgi:hypothetical protein